MNNDKILRDHILYVLQGGGAHLDFETAFADIPADMRGAKVPGSTHTLWRLLEHLRLCQWDILEFSRNADHISPKFPDGYWPNDEAPANNEAWENSLTAFRADMRTMQELVTNPKTDLYAPI